MSEKSSRSSAVALWLVSCVVMVALMVWIGGLTRLTDSGLSMTNWHPIHGVIPPMSDAEWEEEFDAYKLTPEFMKINYDMNLSGFKRIFYVEWFHRILGRIAGLVFAVPFLIFYLKGWLNNRDSLRLLGIFILGGMQGFIGWFMVQSGLVDDPRVSPYRLSLHLGLAFILAALLWWQAMKARGFSAMHPSFKPLAGVVAAVVFVQIIFGGLVAGFDAGLTYNTYPLMDGELVPTALISAEAGLFNSVVGVQFIHRIWAIIALISVAWLSWHLWRAGHRNSFIQLTGLMAIQFALGIITLVMNVPIALASAHQMVALLLWLAVIGVVRRASPVL